MTTGIFDPNYRIASIFDSAYRIPPIFDAGISSLYIQSVQDFEIVLDPNKDTNSAVISTVDLNYSWIEIGFYEVDGSDDNFADCNVLYELTDANTVSIYRSAFASLLTNSIIARGRVVHAKPALVNKVEQLQIIIGPSDSTGGGLLTSPGMSNAMLVMAGVYADTVDTYALCATNCLTNVVQATATDVLVNRFSAASNPLVQAIFAVDFNPLVILSSQAIETSLSGTISDIAISALGNINNCLFRHNGAITKGGGIQEGWYGGTILNATTARLFTGAAGSTTANFKIMEFKGGVLKSNMRVGVNDMNSGTATKTVPFATLSHTASFLCWDGFWTDATAYKSAFSASKMQVADSVLSDRTNSSGKSYNYWQIPEFN